VKVGIKLNVDPSGAVSDASIASQGPSKYFADLALKAAQGWKFEPAVANGQPVSSVWQLRFKFRRSGTEVVPLEENP
jgi:TonB family protein